VTAMSIFGLLARVLRFIPFHPLLKRKQIAVHFGIDKDVDRRHADGFEAHDAAAIGEFSFISDMKMLTGKAIYRCCRGWFFCHLTPVLNQSAITEVGH
jgi:hypothetical protein